MLTAQAFIEDPTLFEWVERHWRQHNWLALFGEEPVGAVMATIPEEGGVVFWYKATPVDDDHGDDTG